MKKRLLSIITALALCLGLLPAAALAADAVEYVDANGDEQTQNGVTQITESSALTTWNPGWYVVNGDVTVGSRVTVSGEVNLILADGCTLTVSGGINVSGNNILHIYGQNGGTGKLTANSTVSLEAGIGGGGNITICGGTVTATGGSSGAGIGGGDNGDGGNITICGGTVTATGGSSGAGIGGGDNGDGGNITISGGTVKAIGGGTHIGGAGIGGGYNGDGGTTTISGNAKVTATGGTSGAGIGGGYDGDGGTTTISGNAKVTATGGSSGAGIGGGYDGDGGNITISGDAEVTATGGIIGAGIGGGRRGNGGTVEIFGSAEVTATGGDGAAGIGGGFYGNGGRTTIEGGTVKATGGNGAAGIGGGNNGDGDTTNISGNAKVTATGGVFGAGIGGGNNGAGGTTTIAGDAEVTANGGAGDAANDIEDNGGAGIGGGYCGSGGTTTISSGTVKATGGGRGAGIGSGYNGSNSSFSTGTDGDAVIYTSSISDQTGKAEWSGIVVSGSDGSTTYTVCGGVIPTEDIVLAEGDTVEFMGTGAVDSTITVGAGGGTLGTEGSVSAHAVTIATQTAGSGSTNVTITAGDPMTIGSDGQISVPGGSTVEIDGEEIIVGEGGGTVAPSGAFIANHKVAFNMNGHGAAIDGQTIAAGSKVTKPADPSESGYTFSGWYKDAACTTAWNFGTDIVTGNITLYAKWTENSGGATPGDDMGDGSGGGGSGGGSYTPPVRNVTVPISGDDGSIHVAATVRGSTATIRSVDLSELDTVIGEGVDTGVVTIDFSGLNRTIDTVTLPANIVRGVAEAVNDPQNDAQSLEIVLSDGISIEFDAASLKEKAAQANGQSITISIENAKDTKPNQKQEAALKGRPAYEISVTSGGKHISDMGGQITVHAPYELQDGEHPNGVIVWYVDGDGNKERCETSYDPVKKHVNWKTDHLSLYMIDYCPGAAYDDVDTEAWYHEAVDYVIENELMGGYGDGVFKPNGNVTRQQVWMILARMSGKAPADMAEARAWAMENGVSDGTNPTGYISRQQFATMLWRYAKETGVDVSVGEDTNILSYTDVFDISEYAIPAMQWACGAGVMGGYNDGSLKPLNNATRAHLATMLRNFLE